MDKTAETYLGAVALADDGAALKQEIEEMVYQMVLTVLDRMLMQGDSRLTACVQASVRNMEWEIKKMALRAVRDQWVHPQINY